jgi:hypothetical protein
MSNHITHLSFTRLKHLAHSPLRLRAYLDGDERTTKAMDEGSLLDVLLFTPHLFDEQFVVMPDGLKKPTAAQVNAKKPSPDSVEQIREWESFQSSVNGRRAVTVQQVLDAQVLESKIRENSTVAFNGLLNPDFFRFQEKVSFEWMGFYHRGIVDAIGAARSGEDVIWDLKRMGASSGERLVRNQIRSNKYDLQAAIYCHQYDVENKPIRYFVIAVDNEGYVTPFEIGRDAREQAKWEWRKLVKAAHRCNMEGLDMGPEFWADSEGFFHF